MILKDYGIRCKGPFRIYVLELLRKKPLINTEMPSIGRVNLLHQPEQNRYVVHMMFSSLIQRGSFRVIEDFVPLYDIPFEVDFLEKIKEAYLVPSGEIREIKVNDREMHVTIPKLKGHTAVVFEYDEVKSK